LRRLPPQVEREILKRALQCGTYRELAREFGVSVATVSRVFEDARKIMPDVDSLRELSILLRKAGLTVFDATRSCRAMESLNKWGISLEELDGYVRLNERFLSERALDESFLSYALKLMQLEQVSGRTFQEVVEDFEKKGKEATEAEERKLALENESLGLKAELNETKVKLAELKSEIEKATNVRKGLAEIGLNKLAQLVRFIQDFESLGFDANEVKRLAMWHRGLQELHIGPDELDKYIAERGPLETQNNNLKLANERIEADVNAHAIRKETLLAENFALQAVDLILRTGTLTMRCESCGHPLPIWLPTQESFWNLKNTGQVLIFKCQNCDMPQSFTPWEIAFQIAWVILPTN
jgi:transcriptional regulator with XRE-family HTH domain